MEIGMGEVLQLANNTREEENQKNAMFPASLKRINAAC